MLKRNRILRFTVVGITNAAISFAILNLAFYTLHQNKIISSIISTGCALVFSFVMNRGFVFVDKTKRPHQQIPAFVIVTVSGSLLMLNLVYIASLRLLNGHEAMIAHIIKDASTLTLSKSFIDINLSTVVGAVVAMVWNYNGYKWFVFKGSGKDVLEEIELTT